MSNINRLPIQVVLPRETDYTANTSGGGKKYTEPFTPDLQKSLVLQCCQLQTSLQTSFERFPSIPCIGKVIMKEKAIAKSHKPTALFKPNTCPIVGADKLNEIIVKITPQGLNHLINTVNKASSEEVKINITKIKEIKAYSLEDKIEIKDFDSQDCFSQPIKVKLFSFDDATNNEYYTHGFENHVKRLGLEAVRLNYGKNLCVYKLYCKDKEILKNAIEHPGGEQRRRNGVEMQVIYERCCGIDVHKRKIAVCLKKGRQTSIRQFGTYTRDLKEMTTWLKEEGCEMVAMESTGPYWKPLYNIFELEGICAIVVNAAHMKALPGRKTDDSDAAWIADLLQHGLLKASFIPDRKQRELRDLTRYRKSRMEERAREINRLQKILEGANIKICSTVTDIMGQSAQKLLKLVTSKHTITIEEVADAMNGNMKASPEEIILALEGVVTQLQRELIVEVLHVIGGHTTQIARIEELIQRHMDDNYCEAAKAIDEIPGIAKTSAQQIVAEIGTDMSRFPTENHLCSWSGICPGNNESAGKKNGQN